MDDERVYIMDVYNRGIYPHDGFAKRKFIFTRYIFTVKVFYFVGVNFCGFRKRYYFIISV